MFLNQPLVLWIMLYKYNLPNELIIKILYEFKGLTHPLAIQIDNGLGWDWSNKVDLKKKIYYLKSFMFLRNLNNTRYFIRNNLDKLVPVFPRVSSDHFLMMHDPICFKCGLLRRFSDNVPLMKLKLSRERICFSSQIAQLVQASTTRLKLWNLDVLRNGLPEIYDTNVDIDVDTYFIDETSYYYWCQTLQDIYKKYNTGPGKYGYGFNCFRRSCNNCFDQITNLKI
jgi:hypothetical protein